MLLNVVLMRVKVFCCQMYQVKEVMCWFVLLIVEGSDCGLVDEPYNDCAENAKP